MAGKKYSFGGESGVLISQLCKESDFDTKWLDTYRTPLYRPFQAYIRHYIEINIQHLDAEALLPILYHRKLWEFCYIYQAMSERGMLTPGSRGLGFGVGREPLVSLFASHGCRITATDLDLESAQQAGWAGSDQHAGGIIDRLNEYGLCDSAEFARLVAYENVDMNHIPDKYTDLFDFTWSSCAFEHCGSIELGKKFLIRQMECLRPGGIAVHTTEYNLSSNENTVEQGGLVLFRKRDIEDIIQALRDLGHEIEIDLDSGTELKNACVDLPPYTFNPHLRLQIFNWVSTSIGLIIKKAEV
jgi:hypothetical protein